jgi:hypothetical protein
MLFTGSTFRKMDLWLLDSICTLWLYMGWCGQRDNVVASHVEDLGFETGQIQWTFFVCLHHSFLNVGFTRLGSWFRFYWKNMQCGQMWQNVASPPYHTCIWNITKVCTFTTISFQTGVLSCCSHMRLKHHMLECTSHCCCGKWLHTQHGHYSAMEQCFVVGQSYTTDFKFHVHSLLSQQNYNVCTLAYSAIFTWATKQK